MDAERCSYQIICDWPRFRKLPEIYHDVYEALDLAKRLSGGVCSYRVMPLLPEEIAAGQVIETEAR